MYWLHFIQNIILRRSYLNGGGKKKEKKEKKSSWWKSVLIFCQSDFCIGIFESQTFRFFFSEEWDEAKRMVTHFEISSVSHVTKQEQATSFASPQLNHSKVI